MQLFGKKEIQMPHVFSIIIVLIVLCGCLTYIIPSGIYDRIESGGITKIDVDSFHFIDQTPVSPFEWFVAIPEGFAAGASVIAVIFICVAGMSIYTSTGAFTNCINFFIKKSGKKGTGLLIFALMLYFFLNGGLTGAVDGPVALAPIIIGFALAAGYDALTGLSIVCVCAICGFSCGPTNPYTVVVAQEIAGLPPFSGAALRTVCWLAIMAVTFQHISTPHNAINPIYVANKVISSLESIKGQQVDPFDSVIMDIGSIHAGTTAGNIIPESVMIYGNTRAYSNETRMRLKNSLIQMTENICKAFSCQCSVDYMMGYDPVINDDMASKILFSAAENVLGCDQVYKSVPSMGAEDFSSYAALCPCAFGFVETECSYPLHNPHFIADIETIFTASDIFIQAVKSVPGLSPIKANEDDIKSLTE